MSISYLPIVDVLISNLYLSAANSVRTHMFQEGIIKCVVSEDKFHLEDLDLPILDR